MLQDLLNFCANALDLLTVYLAQGLCEMFKDRDRRVPALEPPISIGRTSSYLVELVHVLLEIGHGDGPKVTHAILECGAARRSH